jgi:hypothetical protein
MLARYGPLPMLLLLTLSASLIGCGRQENASEPALDVTGTYRTRIEDVHEAILGRDREKFEEWLGASQPGRTWTDEEFQEEARNAAEFRYEASKQTLVISPDGTLSWEMAQGEGMKTTLMGTWNLEGSELHVAFSSFRSGADGPEESFTEPRRGVLRFQDGVLSQKGLPFPLHRDGS